MLSPEFGKTPTVQGTGRRQNDCIENRSITPLGATAGGRLVFIWPGWKTIPRWLRVYWSLRVLRTRSRIFFKVRQDSPTKPAAGSRLITTWIASNVSIPSKPSIYAHGHGRIVQPRSKQGVITAARSVVGENVEEATDYAMRPMKQIHIIGGPGSGKSYLARKLCAALNVPLCELDDLFWANDQETYGNRAEPAERDNKLRQFISSDGWIVEGVYYAWVSDSFERADAIVVLSPGPLVRDFRILRRFVLRKLGFQQSAKKETVSSLVALIRWNHSYDRNNLVASLEHLQAHESKVHTFRTADQAAAFVMKYSSTGQP